MLSLREWRSGGREGGRRAGAPGPTVPTTRRSAVSLFCGSAWKAFTPTRRVQRRQRARGALEAAAAVLVLARQRTQRFAERGALLARGGTLAPRRRAVLARRRQLGAQMRELRSAQLARHAVGVRVGARDGTLRLQRLCALRLARRLRLGLGERCGRASCLVARVAPLLVQAHEQVV